MSLSRESVLELMSLADGELDGEAKARAERIVASDAEARRLVDAMRTSPVGGWLRGVVDERAAAATAGLADAVMARVVAPPRRARRPRRGPAVVASAGVGLALAAGAVLYLRSGREPSGEVAPAAGVAAYASRPPGPGAAPRAPGLEITEVYAVRADAGASVEPSLRLPQLARAPALAGYGDFAALARTSRPLEEGKALALPIADGRTLHLTLDPAGAGVERSYRVRASVGEPGRGAALGPVDATVAPGQPLFVGGERYRDGALFVEIVLR